MRPALNSVALALLFSLWQALVATPVAGQTLPFSPPSFLFLGDGGWSYVVHDFDGDGLDDLATVDAVHGRIALGDGRGGLVLGPRFLTNSPPYGLAAGDLNGDGYGDMGWQSDGFGVFVVLSNGQGGFQDPQALGQPSWQVDAIEIRDCDGDGHLDVANVGGGWLGDGAGAFSPGAACQPLRAVIGDFNGDGWEDRARLLILPFFGETRIRLALGSPGGLGAEVDGPFVPTGTDLLGSGDVSGDGSDDLILSAASPPRLGVATANGTGNFGDPSFEPIESYARSLRSADIDGDHRLEFVVATASLPTAQARFFRGSPAGRLIEYGILELPAPPGGFALIDLARDGAPELVSSDGPASGLWVFPNRRPVMVEVPSLTPVGLSLLVGLVAAVGVVVLRRRRMPGRSE